MQTLQHKIDELVELIAETPPQDVFTVICEPTFFNKLISFELLATWKGMGYDVSQYKLLAKENLLRRLEEKRW